MTKLKSVAAALALCIAAIPAAGENFFVDENNRALLREEIRTYILENPELLIEALQKWERNQLQAQAEASDLNLDLFSDEIFYDEDSWVGGALDGTPTMVEFLDYNCGFCRRAHGDVQQLLEDDGNIRFVVKEFPILGQDSELASRFAIAVRRIYGDDVYKSVHEAMITSDVPADLSAIEVLIAEMGFDLDLIESEMLGEQISQIIATNRELAGNLGINGTPGFIIGDTIYQGLQSYEAMASAVESSRELNNMR